MTWSVNDYVKELQQKGARPTGLQEKVEQSLRQMFPPTTDGGMRVSTPGVIVDCNRVILLWYLPGLIGPRRRVNICI
jgi:hypothetical protein